MRTLRLSLILSLWMLLPGVSSADILFLKNGHQLEGLVGREEGDVLEFLVSGGAIVFNQAEILRIERSSEAESVRIRDKWEQDRMASAKTQVQVDELRKKEFAYWKAKKAIEAERRREEEERLRQLGDNTRIIPLATDDAGHLFVEAVVNDQLSGTFVIDTGSPTTLLTAEAARRLGMDPSRMRSVGQVMVLNGNYDVGLATLESIALGGLKVTSVEAYVLKDENPEVVKTIKGGLLGMSFLSRFHFAVNRTKKEMLLFKDDSEPSSGAAR